MPDLRRFAPDNVCCKLTWYKHLGRVVHRAKVVKAEAAEIVVMSAHSLTVGQRICFVPLTDLEDINTNRTPPAQTWWSAVIWRIDQNCLHLTRT